MRTLTILAAVTMAACSPLPATPTAGDEGQANDGGPPSSPARDGGGGGGGGGGVAVARDWVSGSRIRARVLVTSDGAKQFLGWHDAAMGIDCGFQTAADGQTRCLPASRVLSIGTYYADAGCTVSIAVAPNSDCAPSYVSQFDGGGSCAQAAGLHIYHAVAYADTVYHGSPASCAAYTDRAAYPYNAYNFATPGTEIQASDFAAATIAVE